MPKGASKVRAPAAAHLGKGIYSPHISSAPFDADELLKLSNGRRIVQEATETTPWSVPGGEVTFEVPINVSALEVNSSNSLYHTYQGKKEAISDFETSIDLEGSYLSFSGSASISMALQNAFKENSYLALFNFAYSRYTMQLSNATTFPDLIRPELLAELKKLPRPFNEKDYELVHAYDEFLFRWGTHIVTAVTVGQRFFFNISHTSTESLGYQDFKACVGAQYSGLSASVSGEASLKSEKKFKDYMSSSIEVMNVAGGDPTLHAALAVHPDDVSTFKAWSGNKSAVMGDKPTHVVLTSVAEVLRMAPDEVVSAHADDIEAAIRCLETKRTTTAPLDGPAISRPCLFVKVKDGAAKGKCTLQLSDDGEARLTPASLRGVYTQTSDTSGDGFTYGSHNQAITLKAGPTPPEGTRPWFDNGYLARFSLTYGPTTTVTLTADENIEYVIFASGQGFSQQLDGCTNWRSNHVYWHPDADPTSPERTLVLEGVDLGQGAKYLHAAKPGPRAQFALWETFTGLGSKSFLKP